MAKNCWNDIVKLLMNAEVEMGVADEDGKTPLHLAVEKEHTDIVNLLLDARAEVGVTPTRWRRYSTHRRSMNIPSAPLHEHSSRYKCSAYE